MSISRHRRIHWFWVNFLPLMLMIDKKMLLESLWKFRSARNSSKDIDWIICFTVSHIIASTAWRIINWLRFLFRYKILLWSIFLFYTALIMNIFFFYPRLLQRFWHYLHPFLLTFHQSEASISMKYCIFFCNLILLLLMFKLLMIF